MLLWLKHFYILIPSADQKEGLLAPRPKSASFLNVARLAESSPASRTTCRHPAPDQWERSAGIPTNQPLVVNSVTWLSILSSTCGAGGAAVAVVARGAAEELDHRQDGRQGGQGVQGQAGRAGRALWRWVPPSSSQFLLPPAFAWTASPPPLSLPHSPALPVAQLLQHLAPDHNHSPRPDILKHAVFPWTRPTSSLIYEVCIAHGA